MMMMTMINIPVIYDNHSLHENLFSKEHLNICVNILDMDKVGWQLEKSNTQ